MLDVRSTQPDEWRTASDVFALALMSPPVSDEDWADRLSTWEESDSVSAWEGDRCVGHASGFRLDTTVPGGERLKTIGVTRVGVLPTHTRQGALTRMMRQLLVDARGNGNVLASLRASEAVIYERYGFAVAGEVASAVVVTREAGPVRAPAPGSIRILDRDEVIETATDIYERCGRWRVGSVARPAFFTSRYLKPAVEAKKASFVAVHTNTSGELDGYVHYDTEWKAAVGNEEDQRGFGEVHDLFGADASVERALWAYLLGIDLVHQWRADMRPIDDPVRFAIRDARAYQVRSVWDEQWLRILDVDAALRSRAYRPAVANVVIEVADPLFADNTGRWRIDATGASRCTDEPDISVDIATISAAYLGGTSWASLAGAGRLGGATTAAVAAADTLFASTPAPFCGSFF